MMEIQDGDTLEISENMANKCAVKMTDAALAKCSKGRLQQMLATGQITRQQYTKAVKGK